MEEIELNIFYSFLFDNNTRYHINKLNKNMFVNKEYFNKIKELYSDNKLEQIAMLKFDSGYTNKIIDSCFTSSNIDYCINELKESYNKKILKTKLTKAINDLSNGEKSIDIISYINKDSEKLYEKLELKNSTIATEEMFEYLEYMNKAERLCTGIKELDNLLGGIQRGNLIIISARASSGKTTFAIQTALNMANKKHKVLFISLEMNSEELAIKIYSRLSQIDSRDILYKNMENMDKLSKSVGEFTEMNFTIDDRTQYIEDILSNIKMLKSQNKVDVVFIDYIGLIKTREKSFSRENEVSKISRDLKLVARECNIPIVLLAQLNRLAENSEPSLAMLRESGSLEQDSNKVIFLYQEEDQKANAVGLLKIKVAKNREGLRGTIELGFDKRIGMITPVERR